MVKICNHECFTRQPSYNIEGKFAIVCASHTRENMVNALYKRFNYNGCMRSPIINKNVGEKKGLLCSDHKTEIMVDISNKRCVYDGCEKLATFNIDGVKKGLMCAFD